MTESWPRALNRLLDTGPCVLVTIISIKGSAPRALGCRMMITKDRFEGSIGGGNLEFQAIAMARKMLNSEDPKPVSERYGLGPELNQCCGGAVTLRFETFSEPADWMQAPEQNERDTVLLTPATGNRLTCLAPPAELKTETPVAETDDGLCERLETGRLELNLYGAGHVGKAVVAALEELPFDITWYDGRAEEFPTAWPASVTPVPGDDGLDAAQSAPPGTLHLVMTHSHELDEAICHAVLTGEEPAWLGLIGSRTKRARFRHRLRDRGVPEQRLGQLICPIGLPGLSGKRPATIAVAVAAQLLAEQVPEHLK